MRSISILVVCSLIAFFTFSFSLFKRSRDHTTMAKEIRTQVEKKLVRKHQMECIGQGGGMMGSVYMLGLHFLIYHPLEQDEARQLIVDCVEELLAAVNANEEIRPFLKNYPFSIQNVDISVFSRYRDGRDVFDPYIRVVSIYKDDKIYFRTKEPGKIPYKNEYVESYYEALAKVKGTNPQVGIAEPTTPKAR